MNPTLGFVYAGGRNHPCCYDCRETRPQMFQALDIVTDTVLALCLLSGVVLYCELRTVKYLYRNVPWQGVLFEGVPLKKAAH
jgi:hypothetical protein